jgi:hypothetical protein
MVGSSGAREEERLFVEEVEVVVLEGEKEELGEVVVKYLRIARRLPSPDVALVVFRCELLGTRLSGDEALHLTDWLK